MHYTSGRARPDAARIAILCAIGGAHGFLYWALTASGDERLLSESTRTIGMLFFPQPAEPPMPPRSRPPPSRAPTQALPQQPSTEPHAPDAGSPIDWALAAEESAARTVQADEEGRRRGRAFDIPQTEMGRRLKPQFEPAPEFGWSHSSVNRIEPLEGGGMLVWINDRCAIVFNGLFFPVCRLGKTEARGDLFEHMNDPPKLIAEP